MAGPRTALDADETVVREGRANLQRRLETVGGRAFLTSSRLIFEPHALNAQREVEIVRTADIRGVRKGFTKFLGCIPLVPNAVVLDMGDRDLRLTVNARGRWAADLTRLAPEPAA